MFDAETEDITPGATVKYKLTANGAPLTYAYVLELWASNDEFRTFFSRLLADSTFLAFRWETPALSLNTVNKPFEFVLLNSPGLCSRSADSRTFSKYYTDDEADFGIVAFDNLGGDATMIVPSPRVSERHYGHLADFVRGAPSRQVDALWRVIGRLAASRLSETPFWINTEGRGVAWLHVRLDSRPKYYGYRPYRSA